MVSHGLATGRPLLRPPPAPGRFAEGPSSCLQPTTKCATVGYTTTTHRNQGQIMKRTITALTITAIALIGGATTAHAKGNAWDTITYSTTR